ncbi:MULTISPECIES: hypothetical protein [Rubritalea]|nr:hypothetical protein [Rubritalea squalenifaciens]
MEKRTVVIAMLGAVSLGVTSCNTFVGVGRDFKRLGEGVENTAYGKTWDGQPRRARQPQYTPPSNQVAPQ